ncbi:MAG TPA: RND transporter, partial [Noviherbaspirillum sp.]
MPLPSPSRHAVLALALLGGCAATPPAAVTPEAPLAWQAPLPHQGSNEALSAWWRGQGDPLLADLIDAAQAASPTLAAARAQIAEALATRVAAGAALM